MNGIVKGLLIFLGGAVVGGGASFFATRSIIMEKNEKDISDRVQNALAEYRAHELSKLNNDIKEEIKEHIIKNEEKSDTSEMIKEYSDKIDRYKPTDIFVDEPNDEPEEVSEDETVEKHNAFIDSKRINEKDIFEEEEGEDDEQSEREDSTDKSSKKPYIISPEEFQYDHTDDYEKESFIFFKDNILTDENYKEISAEDAQKLLGGPKIFTSFGSKGAKDNLVYIRNEMLHTDYEVFHSPRKYTNDVLHMEDEEEE